MIHVTKINEVNGNLQLAIDGASVPEFDTAEQYAEWSTTNNALITCGAYDADIAEMGDEDGQLLATAIRKATGAVQGAIKRLSRFLSATRFSLNLSKRTTSKLWTSAKTIVRPICGPSGE